MHGRGLWCALALAGVLGCAEDEELLRVSDGEVPEVGKADGDAPKVELKLTLADSGSRVRDRLQLGKSAGERRWISFYDTPSLALFEAGIVLRSRRIEGKDDDSTVKLRPLDPTQVAPAWFLLDDFKCETDRTLARSVDSCSLSDRQAGGEIAAVARGERSIDTLFDDEQERFLVDHAAREVDFDALSVLGPVDARVWKLESDSLPAKLTVEIWRLPSGREIVELSAKVKASDADETMRELIDWIERRRLRVAEQADTKTRATLEVFAQRLQR